LNEIEKSRRAIGQAGRTFHARAVLLDLAEHDEGSATETFSFEEFNALLSTCDGLDDDVVKHRARRRDRNVILWGYRAEVSKPAAHARVGKRAARARRRKDPL